MYDALHSIKNFRQATATLATSGQPQSEHFAAMAAAGYVAVINLALHGDPRYSLPDESGDVRAAGMNYIHIPVLFDQPTQSDLTAFMDAMDQYQGKQLWVHCAANMRVTAFVGLYHVLRLGQQRQQAFALMHSVWEPNAVWAAFIEAMLSSSVPAN